MMKTRHTLTRLALLLAASFVPVHAGDPVVTNVSASQRAGTKLVDITFQVADADSDQLEISVNVSDDAGATFQVPSSALTGDTTVNATPSATSKALVWDAGIDFNQQFSSDMVVRVIADDGSATGPPPPGMKLIPAGLSLMGDDLSGLGNEKPAHLISISAFYMDKFEVTKALWDKVKGFADSAGYAITGDPLSKGSHHPVFTVSWYDAVKWCNARSEMEGLRAVYYTSAARTEVYRSGLPLLESNWVDWQANGYRLPTEAEWEKASRGNLSGADYPWGDDIDAGDAATSSSRVVGFYDGGQFPTPGPDRGNGYGLYDMAGNVKEWCWDWYDENWYDKAQSRDADTRGPATPITTRRVVRGGAFDEGIFEARCAHRDKESAAAPNGSTGFRCVRKK